VDFGFEPSGFELNVPSSSKHLMIRRTLGPFGMGLD